MALHVPLGKLNTERLVPIDDSVCQLVHRLRPYGVEGLVQQSGYAGAIAILADAIAILPPECGSAKGSG